MKFENIDLVDALRRIMDKRTLNWTQGCFTVLPIPNPPKTSIFSGCPARAALTFSQNAKFM